MELKIKCSDCEQIFHANSKTVKQEKVRVFKDGKQIKLIRYECPFCSNKVLVQIDNDDTDAMLRRCKRLILSRVKKLRKNKELSDEQQEQLAELQENLKQQRYELADIYNGLGVISDNGTEFIIDASYIMEARKVEREKIEKLKQQFTKSKSN